jgi:glycosyltransferase involved in cell wall biosynthesis
MKSIFLSFAISDSSVTEYFIELANQLSKEYRVVVITDSVSAHPFAISKDIQLFTLPSGKPGKLSDFPFLAKKIAEYRPETMIAIFGNVNLFLLAGFFCRVRNRIAWCRSISIAFEKRRFLQYRKRLIYKLATKIFANSNATKKDLIENFGVNPNKIDVFYNAVSAAAFPGVTVRREKIVFVGRLHPSKGIDILFDALPLILEHFPHTKLAMVGGHLEGNVIKKYRRKAEELGIDANVEFLGIRPKNEVLRELASAYVSVVPSLAEAFGFVVIESFSVGTPVIGSDNTGIAEIIRHGQDGFLFETANAADLAQKTISLLGNQALRTLFSVNCHERFLHHFELRKEVGDLVIYLKTI